MEPIGLLDFRIYDRALSAVEVKALYELGEGPVQESGSGTTLVNGTVADGSITTNQLSEQILKYLKLEITQQPTGLFLQIQTVPSPYPRKESTSLINGKRMDEGY